MTKPRYTWNHAWKFWAKEGGQIGYTWLNHRWCYCWIEPNCKNGKPMLLGFFW
jgi:hypothetical protein